MQLNPGGAFLSFELTEEEELSVLANPLLLAYLKTKQASYASSFLEGNFACDPTKPVDPVTVTMRVIDQQGKFAMLSELIAECEQAAIRMDEVMAEAAAQSESSQDSQQPQQPGF